MITNGGGWVRTIEDVSGEKPKAKQLALFSDAREELPILACETIRVRLDSIELCRPRQYKGHCDIGGISGSDRKEGMLVR